MEVADPGLVILVLCYAWFYYSSYQTLRYRVTVTISTPDGDITGSAVKEAVRSSERSIFPEPGGIHYGVSKGEAVAVDLGKRGVIFMLQSWEDEAELAFQILENKNNFATKVFLNRASYPKFVVFKDTKDPATVELAYEVLQYDDVDPKGHFHGRKCCHVTDNLPEEFGEGVSIKSITFEKTIEPVTSDVEKYLPWLEKKKGVPGVIGSTPTNIIYRGNLGLTGIELSKGKYW